MFSRLGSKFPQTLARALAKAGIQAAMILQVWTRRLFLGLWTRKSGSPRAVAFVWRPVLLDLHYTDIWWPPRGRGW